MKYLVFLLIAGASYAAVMAPMPPTPPQENRHNELGSFTMSHTSQSEYQCDKAHSFFLVAVSKGNRHYLMDIPDSFEVVRCLTSDQADHIGAALMQGNIAVAKVQ